MNEESSSAPPQQRPSTAAAASRARARPTIRKPAISVLPHQTPRLRDHYLLGKKLGQGQPNVVQIKDTYEDSMFVHLVMELCAGGELFDRIVAKGHYSEKEAAKVDQEHNWGG
ncbi:hypothetical protein OIU77_006440 [Salix suchowensis]|uniref:Protein kinase domain-containing protein n=1 Tax=Salix suchowensis TaxID=1278906 RepID=A0ABQ9AM50_9ROSI|nr:hypothetical protein OIU77_006440 [Salix suchowensis]